VVADVGVVVGVVLVGSFQALAVPLGGGVLAEEGLAEVVVDADDIEAFITEKLDGFRTDEAGGAGNDGDSHGDLSCWRLGASFGGGLRAWGLA